ncbi:MAG: hybrid sensor histidine kinase/response regulator [Pirellulales bacterium]
MFELFRTEAEAHSALLSDGLLAIEASPADLSHVEQLMRAAHSIKGAARIVDLDIIVELAHAMEDCFVAVQKGEESLATARVDQLLLGVDVIQELSTLKESELDQWLSSQAQRCQLLTESLRHPAVEAPRAPESPAPKATESVAQNSTVISEPEVAAQQTTPEGDKSLILSEVSMSSDLTAEPTPNKAAEDLRPEAPAQQRTVPVNASNLDQIMRLASESMVEARQLQSLKESIATLQEVQRNHNAVLDKASKPNTSSNPLAAAAQELRELGLKSQELLQEHSRRLERALWRSERTATALYHQVVGSRMRPFKEGTQAFPRMIRDLSKSLGKQVVFELVGGAVSVDRDILRKLEAPLNHILRNCIDHAIEKPDERRTAGKPEAGRVVLEARHHAGLLTIAIQDDGRGIDAESLRSMIVDRKLVDASMAAELTHAELFEFLFLPGFSTASQVTEVSGRGVGLDVVLSMVQEVSGTVQIESKPGQGAVFVLRLPVTLSVMRAALAEIAGELYAFPLTKLERIVRVPVEAVRPVQGRQQFTLNETSVGLVHGTEILDLGEAPPVEDNLSVVVIGQKQYCCGIVVDRFIGEQDLVVRPLDQRLGKVPHISAAALTEEGEPLLIVDVEDMLHSIRQLLGEGRLRGITSLAAQAKKSRLKVLVVDDSITVREVERQLLSAQGYDVDVAVDGQDGWHALRANSYDLLISDVDMPRMNGIELIQTVRQDPRFEQLPIIIVSYKDREEDRLRGFEVGANAYLTKGSFHDDSFVRTVADLIGELD